MSLAGILSIVADDPRLSRAFETGAAPADRSGAAAVDGTDLIGTDLIAPPALRPVLTAAITARLGRFVLAVTATAREAEDLTAALGSFLPESSVACFPGWETLPHERLSPRSDTVGQRIAVLRRLAHPDAADDAAGPLSVVVAPVRCLLQPIVAGLGDLEPVRLRAGDACDPDELLTRLVEIGYAREDLVGRRGDVAVRGGIIDVFSPTDEHPVRIEFFGDTVEEIRYFKVADQRSLGEAPHGLWAPPCRELLLTPAVRDRAKELAAEYPGLSEVLGKLADGIAVEGMEAFAPVLADRMDLLTDYLPADGILVACDPERIRARAEELVRTSREFLDASWVNAAAGGHAPIDLGAAAFQPIARVREAARARQLPWWTIEPFGATADDADGPQDPGRSSFGIEASPARSYRGAADGMIADIRGWLSDGLAGRPGHRGARPGAAADRDAARRGSGGPPGGAGGPARAGRAVRHDRPAGARVHLAVGQAGRTDGKRPGRDSRAAAPAPRTCAGCRAGAAAASTRCS